MPGPIPWQAVNEWAIRNQVNGAKFAALVAVINAIDSVYLDAYFIKQKAEIKKNARTRSRTHN